MDNDKLILSEFKKAIRGNTGDFLDLDRRMSQQFAFQVYRFEDVLRDTNRSIPPNRWSYYRIGLIKKGTSDFLTGIYKFTAKKNTLIVVPPRVISGSKNWSMDVEGYVAVFNLDFFLQSKFPHSYIETKKILSPGIRPYIHLNEQQAAAIEPLFETMLKENKAVGNNNEMIALKLIELLIISERFFDEELHFENNLPSINTINLFSELMDLNILKEHSVKFYAEKLNMHPNYLNTLIKKNTGISAKESIQNRLLLEAKYLLHSTRLTIKEISAQTGFNDPNYFTSFFTRCEKMSPGQYRSSFI